MTDSEHRPRFLVIGGGPAGHAAATTAATLGLKVTLVEDSIVGGAAHLWDCIPSKAMIASSMRLSAIRNAARLGISDAGVVAIDMERIAERLTALPARVLVQGELPKRRLIEEFSEDETASLVATMGFWEGIDVPGRALSLVVIDRIPFARPDDPLTQARRDAVERRGGSAFGEVDLPNAAMLLAQGAGRLIRNETDRGVVAILDSRLTGKQYGRRIVASLPRLRRTSDREQAIRFLRELASEPATATGD